MASSVPHPETSSSLPSPPFVPLNGIPNFRDIGGYPISSSPHLSVRRNYIFRCGEPTKASPEAIATIQSLGVTHIYDLRSKAEIQKLQLLGSGTVVTDWPGVERVYVPVFPDEAYDPVSMAVRHADYLSGDADGMTRAYRSILQQGTTAYGQVIRHILEHPPPTNAFIVHCTAGKDRTGVLCALLLSLCGVPDDVVADEYSLTDIGLGHWLEHLVDVVIRHTGANEEAARRMVGARRESMVGAVDMLKKEFGGAECYFKSQCGLSTEEIDKIKSVLIVEEKPIVGLPEKQGDRT